MTPDELTPVVAAVGQAIERETNVFPVDLAESACEVALSRSAKLRDRIDRVSVVNILSAAGSAPAAVLARRLGLRPRVTETSTIGGNSPQFLVTRAASAIAAGEAKAVLVTGAEAQHSRRSVLARRAGATNETGAATPPHHDPREEEAGLPPDPMVGDDRPGAGPAELSAGLIAPIHLYALFESVFAHRAGRSFEEQRAALGELMAPFTEVAARNPYAWFAQAQTPSELSTVDADNRIVSEPYPKRMCAFMQVDQAAAVVVTSLAAAREAGLADQAVFLWSGADASDVWFPSARPDPAHSPGIAAAASAAFSASGTAVDDLASLDLYSCFPCAVQMAVDAIGIDARDPRGLTVTGGLAYFGGPGNDYSLHAIATTAERLREIGGVGLVSGLGWYATKHSIGIYGSHPPPRGWRRADTTDAQGRIDASAVDVLEPAQLESEVSDAGGSLSATVVASTVAVDREGSVTSAPLIAALESRGPVRHLTVAAADDVLASLAGRNLVGELVEVSGSPPRYRPA